MAPKGVRVVRTLPLLVELLLLALLDELKEGGRMAADLSDFVGKGRIVGA